MIREATPADLPRLRAIQAASLEEPWEGLLEPAVGGPPVVRVATVEGAASVPVGYAVAIPEADGAYLAEFAVAPGHRREGHGSRLLSDLLERLAGEGFESVRLAVRARDEGAREFYGRHGFTERSRLPDGYEAGDGLVLARSL